MSDPREAELLELVELRRVIEAQQQRLEEMQQRLKEKSPTGRKGAGD
jgi:hypothetical protein